MSTSRLPWLSSLFVRLFVTPKPFKVESKDQWENPTTEKLVGGCFPNPFEKYARQIGSFCQVMVKIKSVF